MSEQTSSKSKDNRKWIVFLVIAVLVGGGVGYVYGSNKKEADLQQAYAQQIEKLEEDVDSAKKNASGTVAEGQETVAEGQQTIESLQTENAKLKTTIEEQSKKIADLEKQLEEANNPNPAP